MVTFILLGLIVGTMWLSLAQLGNFLWICLKGKKVGITGHTSGIGKSLNTPSFTEPSKRL